MKAAMKIDVFTLFPSMFDGPLNESILKRAREKGLLELNVQNLRDFAKDAHQTVDARPFGGGPGMVLKPEPVFEAVESVQTPSTKIIMLSPSGRRHNQSKARELASEKHLILLCGSYEGFDERIREALADETLSIGDFVLTNGALPAMILIDSVARLLPGVLGDANSAGEESFGENGLLEYPHYTRPAEFRGMKVPEVLLSGNHQEIAKWRMEMSQKRTAEQRPDLLPPKTGEQKQTEELPADLRQEIEKERQLKKQWEAKLPRAREEDNKHTGKNSWFWNFWNTRTGSDISFFKDILKCFYRILVVAVAVFIVSLVIGFLHKLWLI